MATNPFSGIITPELKLLHKNMIDALLEDEALTVECTLTYAETKFTECTNCYMNNVTGKSSGRYKAGGPIPFTNGQCPYCYGAGKTTSESTENMWLLAIWDSKKWILNDPAINVADISVQTMSKITTLPNLNKCRNIKFDTKIAGHGIGDFTRVGHPQPLGWGDSNWIITSWKRA